MWSHRLKTTILTGIFLASINTVSAGVIPSYVGNQKVPSLAPMLERVTPAVVNIATKGRSKADASVLKDPFFQRFLNNPADKSSTKPIDGTGSGVIVHSRLGHILTNYHVIQDAESIQVTLNDGRRFEASIVGTDERADLAILKIKSSDLVSIPFGDSTRMRVGDFVVAIGNPYGIGQSVSSGIVSALHRNPGIGEYENFIQTDASINLGNSGGALVNLNGELVGINTAILGGQSGGNIGIGFAIPINTAMGVIDQIIRYGTVERGEIGIEVSNPSAALTEQAGIDNGVGALITQVFPNSPAEQAGLEAGDIIVRIDNQDMLSASEVKNFIGAMRVGTEISLTFVRKGEYFMTNAVLTKPASN
ncbi:trypsin-like peptidase domain-containing protein [Thiofilum flexile]|uniref:trypsin-like peptidase domain-containing protein n=1 Tax=Thiofilum flexile TaxID=125627 RepID=UPI00037106FB|nr:trypsin-like peptidase domain-containing protein [Thiofilum flexile]